MTAPDLREIVGGAPEAECGGEVLIGPNAIACLVTLGGASRLVDRENLQWRPRSEADLADERLPWLPRALRDARESGRTIYLFARAKEQSEYRALGPAHLWTYGGPYGKETATFSFEALSHAAAARLGHAPAPADAMVGPPFAEAIARASNTAARFALVRRFVESWRGPIASSTESADAMPPAVRTWHAVHADLTRANEYFGCHPAAWHAEDDVHVFHCENQGVIHWAVRDEHLELDDPPVVARFDDAWFDACGSVSEWALQFVITCEAFCCRGVTGWVDLSDELDSVLKLLQPTALADAHWPSWKTRVLVGPQSIAVASGIDNEHGAQLQLATRDDDSFAAEIDRLGLADAPWEVRRS